MDSPQAFQYDVAVSFVANDEGIAAQIVDRLEGRFRTFLYSRRQEELAGTDGEEVFGRVFGKEARLVVVLYRDGWGATRWTRIEEAAIRNRGFEEGYNFTFFVRLDDTSTMPRWLPPTRIYFGWTRYGLEGVAAAIEMRIQEGGGSPKIETLSDKAARLERDALFGSRRSAFLTSHEGVQAAASSVEQVFAALQAKTAQVVEQAPSMNARCDVDRSGVYVYGRHCAMRVRWQTSYSNTLDGSQLEATLWKGGPPRPGYWSFEGESRVVATINLLTDMTRDGALVWVRERSSKKRELSADEAAELLLEWWLEKAQQSQTKRGS